MAYHESITAASTPPLAASRSRALRAAALAARCAKQALAPPAASQRLQRVAHDLSHEKKFDHFSSPCPPATDRAAFPRENVALFAPAMQPATEPVIKA